MNHQFNTFEWKAFVESEVIGWKHFLHVISNRAMRGFLQRTVSMVMFCDYYSINDVVCQGILEKKMQKAPCFIQDALGNSFYTCRRAMNSESCAVGRAV